MTDPARDHHDEPAAWPWASRTPFAGWLHAQHLRADAIGALAAALRGDPDNPNPANGRELTAYLWAANAPADVQEIAALAWALYLAREVCPSLALGVSEYAELWAVDEPRYGVQVTAADLRAEITYGSDDELPPADELPALLCDLAPWLATYADTAVRVEGDRITLASAPDLAQTCNPRYATIEDAR
jgi:hypothetical protein